MTPETIYSGFTLSFDQGIAEKVGIDAAILFNHIVYWLKINANKPNAEMIDGKYWMYETNKQMSEFFRFFSEEQISKGIRKLKEAGMVEVSKFNKNPFDHTSWYTVYDQGLIKKSLRNPEIGGIGTRKSAGSEPRKSAESIYTTKEQEKNIQQKQQQQGAAKPPKAAAAFLPKKIESYKCLKELKIPDSEKEWITLNYPEADVKHSVAWATHPITKINTTLEQAIKWGCQHKPEIPATKNAHIDQNKEYAAKYANMENSFAKVEVLHKQVEVVYKGAQKEPTSISYEEKGFKDQLDNALRKCEFQLK